MLGIIALRRGDTLLLHASFTQKVDDEDVPYSMVGWSIEASMSDGVCSTVIPEATWVDEDIGVGQIFMDHTDTIDLNAPVDYMLRVRATSPAGNKTSTASTKIRVSD